MRYTAAVHDRETWRALILSRYCLKQCLSATDRIWLSISPQVEPAVSHHSGGAFLKEPEAGRGLLDTFLNVLYHIWKHNMLLGCSHISSGGGGPILAPPLGISNDA
jgi:hypothetical protein